MTRATSAESANTQSANAQSANAQPANAQPIRAEALPIRMLHDRVLVSTEGEAGERRSGSGIVIPATASMGKRLSWGRVVAIGQHVRQVAIGDRVLFDPQDRAEVELQGSEYVLLRERDLHAVAAAVADGGQTGLYL